MKFLEKVRKLGKRAKLGLCTAIAAVSVSAISCIASAEEEVLTTKEMLTNAGNTLTTSFNDLITTMIPVVMGILGSGLVIFGIMALIKLAKKIFGKVAG